MKPTKIKYIEIRPSMVTDFKEVSQLIYITGPELFRYMLGEKCIDVISYLFKNKKNLFSYEHCNVCEIKGEIAGMVLSYDYLTLKNESKDTGKLMMKYYGLSFISRIIGLVKMNRIISDLTEDDYYISNIALFEKFRGQGIGRRLIEYTIEEAKRLNKKRLCLDVDDRNIKAIKFYSHVGFKNINVKRVNFGINKKIILSRMAKDL